MIWPITKCIGWDGIFFNTRELHLRRHHYPTLITYSSILTTQQPSSSTTAAMPPLPLLLPLLPPFMNFLGISQNTLENTFGKPNTFGNISKNHILPRSHNSSGTKSLWRLLDSNILLRLLCLNFSLPVTCPISTLCLGPPCNLHTKKNPRNITIPRGKCRHKSISSFKSQYQYRKQILSFHPFTWSIMHMWNSMLKAFSNVFQKVT